MVGSVETFFLFLPEHVCPEGCNYIRNDLRVLGCDAYTGRWLVFNDVVVGVFEK